MTQTVVFQLKVDSKFKMALQTHPSQTEKTEKERERRDRECGRKKEEC